jgi:hypothetical protein
VARLHRQRVTTAGHQLVAQRFQGVEAQQPEAFALYHHPVFVAVGQHLSGADHELNIGIYEVGRTFDQMSRPGQTCSEIDGYLVSESEGADRRLDKVEPTLTQSPKSSPKVGARSDLLCLRPQRSGNVAAPDGTVLESQEAGQTLCARLKVDPLVTNAKVKPFEQTQLDRRPPDLTHQIRICVGRALQLISGGWPINARRSLVVKQQSIADLGNDLTKATGGACCNIGNVADA